MPIEISSKAVLNIRAMDSTTVASSAQSPIKSPTIAQHDAGRPLADTVSLTNTAAYLRKLENTLATLPVVDVQRTEGIKKALTDGRFVIDPARVADKLLRFESMLYQHTA